MYGHLYKYRNILNLCERVQVIREYDSELPKPTILALANKYNVNLFQIQNIISQRDAILKKYRKIGGDEICSEMQKEYLRKRHEKIDFLNRVMYEYIQRILFLNLSILDDEKLLQKAMDVKKSIAVRNFRPNALWLKDFKRIYNIPKFDLETLRKNITLTGPKESCLDTKGLISYISNMDKKKESTMQNYETIDLSADDDDDDDDDVHDESIVVSYEVSDDDSENHVDLKSSLKIEVAPTQLSECNVVTDLQTRSEGLQDIDKKKSEENNFSENDLLAINQIKTTSSPAPSDEEEFVTLYEIVDDKDKKANDIPSESPTIKKEPEDIEQTIKIEPSEPMETNDNEELTSSPPLENLNIKTEAIEDSSVNKSKGQNLPKEKEKLIENANGENFNSQQRQSNADSFPDIDNVQEAMRHIKALENYVMLRENYRAIGLISQLESAIKNPANE